MSGGDLLGALPDHVLQHVLSFLPSRQAVQSSVLSRRWRHLWRSTPAIRVHGRGDEFRLFVNTLLLFREGATPLHSFELDADLENDYDYDRHVNLWITYAVSTCHARSLTAHLRFINVMCRLAPLTSRHLTTLRLHTVECTDGFLDFSGCPVLLHLSLSGCRLDADAIVSPSLERLSITNCTIVFDGEAARARTRISTPSIRYLQLSHNDKEIQIALSLESMPSLTTAVVCLTGRRTQVYSNGGNSDCSGHGCLLLHGLSEATNLVLIATSSDGKAILHRELTWCPIFSKLKTLILNEWCVCDDVIAIACLLRHSPVLEKLTLQLYKGPSQEVKTEVSYDTPEQSFVTFEPLKLVEIKCKDVDARVDRILKILVACGIPLVKINIQRTDKQSQYFNFEEVESWLNAESESESESASESKSESESSSESGSELQDNFQGGGLSLEVLDSDSESEWETVSEEEEVGEELKERKKIKLNVPPS